MSIVISGSTNDITVNGVSVATDMEVSSAITDAVQTGLVALQTIATGTATFTSTTNNINLTGISIGVETGDVIQISGAEDAKNNSEFTVEVITDAHNVIVNQAHANKGTNKNIAARSGDTGVTVKLLAKWYNAEPTLGRDWVNLTSSRAFATTYDNLTNRAIPVCVLNTNGTVVHTITTNGSTQCYTGFTTQVTIPRGTYKIDINVGSLLYWSEMR